MHRLSLTTPAGRLSGLNPDVIERIETQRESALPSGQTLSGMTQVVIFGPPAQSLLLPEISMRRRWKLASPFLNHALLLLV
jgi:hypothetical protein